MSRKTAVARRQPEPEVHDLSDLAEQANASEPYRLARAYQQAAVDAVIDSRALRMEAVDDLDLATHEPVIFTAQPEGHRLSILLNDTVHRQVAERIKIPFDYYQRMKATQPDLLAANVNRWLQAEPDRHMLRMLKAVTPEDRERLGRADANFTLRAVRSPKYRCIDNASLLEVALPIIAQHRARVTEFRFTEERFYIRFATKGMDLEEARQALQRQRAGLDVGPRLKVGEVVGFGASISNSEIGMGKWLVDPFAWIIRCENGMIVAESRGGVHLGKEKDDGFISDETRRLEDASVILRVRDKVIEVFSPEVMLQTARAIEAGTLDALSLPKQLPMIEFLGNVGQRFELSQEEVAVLQEETLNDLASGHYQHGLNRFSVSQGFTATAKRAESFERRVELEKMGWQVLANPLTDLLEAGKRAKALKAKSN